MAFTLGKHLVVIDSFQFMSSSLERLVNNLHEETFKYKSKEYQNEKLNLMKQKGVHPYYYKNSLNRF